MHVSEMKLVQSLQPHRNKVIVDPKRSVDDRVGALIGNGSYCGVPKLKQLPDAGRAESRSQSVDVLSQMIPATASLGSKVPEQAGGR